MRVHRLLLAVPLVASSALGLLAWQGITARRTIDRLPEADGLVGEYGDRGDPLHLVVLGDSVAAGVGIAHHDETLAGRLAALFATERAVRRTVVAQSGLAADGVRELAVERAADLADADVVVLSVGVNDAKGLHSARRWHLELNALLSSVVAAAPMAQVVLLGVPDMAMFTRLPRPLRSVLGVHSRHLDRIGQDLAATYPQVHHLALVASMVSADDDERGSKRPGVPGAGADLFAADGFHPSATMHAAVAQATYALLAHEAPRTDASRIKE